MKKEVIIVPNTLNLPLSPAIKAGDFIFVSGQVGFIDADGKEVNGIEAQTRQSIENISRILQAAGSSLNAIVKTTVFLGDWSNFSKMNEVYQSYFKKDYPARSTIVTGMYVPNMLIEIECIACSM